MPILDSLSLVRTNEQGHINLHEPVVALSLPMFLFHLLQLSDTSGNFLTFISHKTSIIILQEVGKSYGQQRGTGLISRGMKP